MRSGDSAGPRLQESDQGRGRAAPSHGGGAGQSWSASDRQCHQGMAQETVSMHCSWWRTFQKFTANKTALFRAHSAFCDWTKLTWGFVLCDHRWSSEMDTSVSPFLVNTCSYHSCISFVSKVDAWTSWPRTTSTTKDYQNPSQIDNNE